MTPRLHRLCWLCTALLLLAAACTGIAKAQSAEDKKPTTGSADDYYELMRVFVDTFQEIDRNYVKEVDRRKLVEAAVRGMLAELDPYSDYIAPDALTHFTEAISQEFGGVGIRVSFDRERRAIEVMTPLPGSPAYEAGIHAGDRIVEIDGQLVKEFPNGQEINTAVKLLRGQPGESVEVVIEHADDDERETVTLTRETIQLDTVMGYSYRDDGHWNFLLDDEKKIGYVRLTHFTNRSAAELREALKDLKKQGLQGLVLDLRYNPGGLLQAAVDVADLFIEEGRIVSTEGRNSVPRSWAAKSFGTFTGFPMAIIINRYSASASEIVSACLQDHDRAVIVGERSWGKGSVQDVIDLEEGKSALKLTTASYHRPSGKNIHRFPNSKESDEWGVMPDDGFKVEFTLEEMREYQKDRQERDVLGRSEYKSDYVDRQLQAALRSVTEQLESPESDAEAPEKQPAAAPNQEPKKAAGRFPFFAVPKTGEAA